LVFLGLGFSYYLLDDESEKENERLTYSWIVLFLWLLSLFIHFVVFIYSEIYTPLVNRICYQGRHRDKIVDLRKFREEGRMG